MACRRLGALLLALAAACATGPAQARGDAASTPVDAIDDFGRRVTLASPARRIVSLSPHATELLFEVGAGPRVVAVERSSDHPPQARALPTLSALPRPDLERVLAHSPDLVVIWGAGASSDIIERLERLGIRVFVSDPRSLEAISATMVRLGRLAGVSSGALESARRLHARIETLRARYAARTAVPVFMQIWSRPLMTLSDRDLIGDALGVCGARNVFADLPQAAAQVDPEQVLRRAPRLILGFDAAGRVLWERLRVLAPAGAIDYVVVDSALQRPTPRALDVLEQVCERIDQVRAGR